MLPRLDKAADIVYFFYKEINHFVQLNRGSCKYRGANPMKSKNIVNW